MGDRISEIVKGVGLTNVAPVTPYEAVIDTTAGSTSDDVFVIIPGIDAGRTTKGPVRWTPISGPNGPILPTKGDIAQVVRTQEGYYWVTQFIPQVWPTDLLIASRVTALEAHDTAVATTIKVQNSSMALQSGVTPGVAWVLNTSGSPFLDLTVGKWLVDAYATCISNVADYAIIGLYNETISAGVGGSGGIATIVGPISGSTGYGTITTKHFITISSNARYRIWVIPNGGSIQSVLASGSVSTAMMTALRIQ